MPKKGWKSITIKEELAKQLEKDGKKHDRSMPEQIEHLVKRAKILEVSEKDREIYRCTLYQIAQELKAQNSDVPTGEIREWLKKLIDVTV